MKWKQSILKGIGVGVMVGAFACDRDPNETKLTYMRDMADAPTTKPQQDYLEPPSGSVDMYSPLYPKSAEEAGVLLQNPLLKHKDQGRFLKEGQQLFQDFCSHCHGNDGKGGGKVVDGTGFPPPPDITNDFYREKKDGYLFYRITMGSVLMPKMGDKLDPRERWAIVLNLRALQGKK